MADYGQGCRNPSRDRYHLRDRMICKFVRSTPRNRRCYTQREWRRYTRNLAPNTRDKSPLGSSLGSEKRWLSRLARPPPGRRRRPQCHILALDRAHSRDVDIEIAPGCDQRNYDSRVDGRQKQPAMRRVRMPRSCGRLGKYLLRYDSQRVGSFRFYYYGSLPGTIA